MNNNIDDPNGNTANYPADSQKNHEPAADRITPINFQPIAQQTTDQSLATKIRTLPQRPAVIGILLVALTSLLILWFVFTARSIQIQITPEHARLDISGWPTIKLGHHYLLRPGQYILTATHDEYFPLQETLLVTEKKQQNFALTLTRLPDHISVQTDPAIEARLIVDGRPVATTPHKLSLAAGRYHLELLSERYLPHSEDLQIQGGGRELTHKISLQPAWATIQISSEPDSAQVSVDDLLIGNTPLSAEILQGEHQLGIKAAGFKTWRSKLQVTAGKDQQLPPIKLEKADGLITIKSEPSQANVLINGKFKGRTPLELALTPARQYKMELFKTGYKRQQKTVDIQSGQELNLLLTLSPELGEVQFKVQPADAQLFINGQLQKTANTTLQLVASNQAIEVRAAGYSTHQTSVTPKPGFTQRLDIRLKTLQQAKVATVKPEILSPAGQKLLLFHPDSFTMGASRREPGRRANETLRSIHLTRPFYLATREVTNAEYRRFDNSHSSGKVEDKTLNDDQQPVVKISWLQAARYCNWLSLQEQLRPAYNIQGEQAALHPDANGYRLPTEAEWEWAARTGPEGLYKFLWGQELPPPKNAGNYADRSAFYLISQTVNNYDDGFMVSAPVGSFRVNRRGLYDMGGNVAEWVNDRYGQIDSGTQTAETDPTGPATGQFHVIRDASWRHGSVVELRLTFRDYGSRPRDDLGFRIARYAN